MIYGMYIRSMEKKKFEYKKEKLILFELFEINLYL